MMLCAEPLCSMLFGWHPTTQAYTCRHLPCLAGFTALLAGSHTQSYPPCRAQTGAIEVAMTSMMQSRQQDL